MVYEDFVLLHNNQYVRKKYDEMSCADENLHFARD